MRKKSSYKHLKDVQKKRSSQKREVGIARKIRPGSRIQWYKNQETNVFQKEVLVSSVECCGEM